MLAKLDNRTLQLTHGRATRYHNEVKIRGGGELSQKVLFVISTAEMTGTWVLQGGAKYLRFFKRNLTQSTNYNFLCNLLV